jgi:hypothetical protein
MGLPATLLQVTPTLAGAGAYSSGNCVGGKQALGTSGGNSTVVMLQSVSVLDKSNQKAPLTLLFFNSDPTAATPTGATVTDQSAFVWGSSSPLFIGKVDIAAADYETIASQAIATKAQLGLPLFPAAGAQVFVVVVTTGTPTYTSASALIFSYGLVDGR